MELAINKPKRSMKLTKKEYGKLKSLVDQKGILEASFEVKVARDTLTRVLLVRSGAEKTILKIRENLPK